MKPSLHRGQASDVADLPGEARALERERMERVWQERATRLARRPVEAGAGQNTRPVMVLTLGEERYCLDLANVIEVLPPVEVTPVPGAPPVFAGVVNIHGEIRPVADLKRLLDMDAMDGAGLARVILLRHQGREMGLKVDRVDQIRWIGAGKLQSIAEGYPGLSGLCLGLTPDMLMLLSAEALFAELLKGTTS